MKKSKTNIKYLMLSIIVIATCFIGIGYAAINSVTFDIKGDVLATTQDEIFITDVNSDTNTEEFSIKGTTIDSSISLEEDICTSTSSIVVTLYNSTNLDYLLEDVIYASELTEEITDIYSNENIKYTYTSESDVIRAGDYLDVILTFSFIDTADCTENILNFILNFEFELPTDQKDFPFTGNFETYTAPYNGLYKLEVWGAQGGTYSEKYVGGYGGYSTGIVYLKKGEEIHAYVGGQGGCVQAITDKMVAGGWNGGGDSSMKDNKPSTRYYEVSGGGGTDFRLISGNWDNESSLYSRLIVAGGGAGSVYFNSDRSGYGGDGGGSEGTEGTSSYNSSMKGLGGTQIAGGTAQNKEQYGKFGHGGDGDQSGQWSGTGGGGGWYGGGAGYNYQAAGGGGSGWIYTEATYNNWLSGNPTDAANWNVSAEYYLTDASTIVGGEGITEPDGTTADGHTGDGYARITLNAPKN